MNDWPLQVVQEMWIYPSALWVDSLMQVAIIVIYLADCGSMKLLPGLCNPRSCHSDPAGRILKGYITEECCPYKVRVVSQVSHSLPSPYISPHREPIAREQEIESIIRTL